MLYAPPLSTRRLSGLPILLLILIVHLFSCSPVSKEDVELQDIIAQIEDLPSVHFTPPDIKSDYEVKDDRHNNNETDKKIIKDGSLSIKTKTLEASKNKTDKLLTSFRGYYQDEQYENSSERLSYTLKIRIPSDSFEQFIRALENGKDELISKSIEARDVSSDYYDHKSRRAQKEFYLKRYQDLLSKTNSVKDILLIEEKISETQTDLENSIGTIKLYDDQLKYSSLELTLFTEKAYKYRANDTNDFSERLKSAFSTGWQSIGSFTLGIITLWPILLTTLLLLWIIRGIWKKRKK